MTKSVHWSTKRWNFDKNYTNKVEIVLPELYGTKSVMWNFHVDDSRENSRYDMIIGWDLLSKLQLD